MTPPEQTAHTGRAESDRKLRQDVFIRVCRDSQHTIDPVAAMFITAGMLNRHPLEIWLALPDWSTIERIADGSHPAARVAEPARSPAPPFAGGQHG